MVYIYSKEEFGIFFFFKGIFFRLFFLNVFVFGIFGLLFKGIKDIFKIKFKKNKDIVEQVGKEGRSGQRNVMEVFREEEEDLFLGDFKEKFQLLVEEDGSVYYEFIFNCLGLGSIVFRRNRILSFEDILDSKREFGFKLFSELF